MKKEKVYLILTMNLLILLIIQSLKYNYLSFYKDIKNEIPISCIDENKNKINKIEDFVILLQDNSVNINTLINEKNKFKATLKFHGELDDLMKYVKYLEEKNILIKSYEIKKDEFLQCIMEVVT